MPFRQNHSTFVTSFANSQRGAGPPLTCIVSLRVKRRRFTFASSKAAPHFQNGNERKRGKRKGKGAAHRDNEIIFRYHRICDQKSDVGRIEHAAWVNRPTSKRLWGDRGPGRTSSFLLRGSAERNVLHTLLLAQATISGLRIRTAASYGSITTIAAWERGIAGHAGRKAIAITASGKGVRIGTQLIGPRALSNIYTQSIHARR